MDNDVGHKRSAVTSGNSDRCDICSQHLDETDLEFEPCKYCLLQICLWCFSKHCEQNKLQTTYGNVISCPKCRKPIDLEKTMKRNPNNINSKYRLNNNNNSNNSNKKMKKLKENKKSKNCANNVINIDQEIPKNEWVNYIKGRFISRDSIIVGPVIGRLNTQEAISENFSTFGKITRINMWDESSHSCHIMFDKQYYADAWVDKIQSIPVRYEGQFGLMSAKYHFRRPCEEFMDLTLRCPMQCRKFHGPYFDIDFIPLETYLDLTLREKWIAQRKRLVQSTIKNRYKKFRKKYLDASVMHNVVDINYHSKPVNLQRHFETFPSKWKQQPPPPKRAPPAPPIDTKNSKVLKLLQMKNSFTPQTIYRSHSDPNGYVSNHNGYNGYNGNNNNNCKVSTQTLLLLKSLKQKKRREAMSVNNHVNLNEINNTVSFEIPNIEQKVVWTKERVWDSVKAFENVGIAWIDIRKQLKMIVDKPDWSFIKQNGILHEIEMKYQIEFEPYKKYLKNEIFESKEARQFAYLKFEECNIVDLDLKICDIRNVMTDVLTQTTRMPSQNDNLIISELGKLLNIYQKWIDSKKMTQEMNEIELNGKYDYEFSDDQDLDDGDTIKTMTNASVTTAINENVVDDEDDDDDAYSDKFADFAFTDENESNDEDFKESIEKQENRRPSPPLKPVDDCAIYSRQQSPPPRHRHNFYNNNNNTQRYNGNNNNYYNSAPKMEWKKKQTPTK